MRVLAIDCATTTVGLALLDAGEVRGELFLNLGRHHAEVLLPALDGLLALAGRTPRDVELLACTVGPGAFTGLRIGVSTVKGLALAWGTPIAGVSTLAALCLNAAPCPYLLCPLLDARKDQVYAGQYRIGPDGLPRAERPDRIASAAEVLGELPDEPIVFVGDGALRHEHLIREATQGRAIIGRCGNHRIMASSVAMIGLSRYREGDVVDTPTFAPCYLRVSEAESTYGKRSGYGDKKLTL
ncbi:MAG: tRNA (adenosine(37)-N6)-threonylcarbamoyltransferase complex dimerization subunit type 1 TsaB [Syntrophales bacterium]